MSKLPSCVLCFQPAPSTNCCPDCKDVFFCQEDHLAFHRMEKMCFPYRVEEKDGKGRCVIATRDIEPGELVLVDRPILLSPMMKSKAQCLQCSKLVDGSFKCQVCGFPMCGERCAGGDLHRVECAVFERVDFEADIEDLKVVDDHYAAILPLRCINLKTNEPKKWDLFQAFLSHCNERKQANEDLWAFHEEHGVDFVKEMCEYGEEFSREEIHRMIGIMSVNSLEIELGEGYGEEMGFYPVFANINHSCLANAKPVKLSDKTVQVKTKTRVAKGDEITIQYLVEIQPTRIRREMINRKWFFYCYCTRCQDSTECKTFLGALLCQRRRCGGVVLTDHPEERNSNYNCVECGDLVEWEEAVRIMNEAEVNTRRKESSDHTVDHIEKFLQKYDQILHPQNYVMTTMKMKLGCLYGNCDKYTLASMSRTMMMRKLQVCQEALIPLNILDQGDLGGNKWKGRLKKEVLKVNYFLQEK